MRPPTKAALDAICSQPNLLIRNLQITQGYHEIALALRSFISGTNVNWFGFGTYASRTAGRALRHETLPKVLKSALIRSAGYDNTHVYLNQVLEQDSEAAAALRGNMLARVLTEVSLLLSEGNLLIFSELAWPFADMATRFRKTWSVDAAGWNRFLDSHFKPGRYEDGGQDWLRESLTSFYRARFETDRKRKAELVLLGNLLVGLHEQSRLQPVIEKVVGVPFDIFVDGVLPDVATGKKRKGGLRRQAMGFTRNLVLRTVTRMTMTYALPTRVMRLGEDVVPPTELVNFPAELLRVENERLRAIIRRYDAGLDTLSGSGALNWASLDDRMSFIVDFFRAYQHYKQLFDPPFTAGQVAVIKTGNLPGGQL